MTVSVLAIQDFALEGHAIYRGDRVELTPIQAAVHAYAGHVSLLHHVPATPTYQTREMVAAPVVTPVAVVASAPTPKRRRRTRRRSA